MPLKRTPPASPSLLMSVVPTDTVQRNPIFRSVAKDSPLKHCESVPDLPSQTERDSKKRKFGEEDRNISNMIKEMFSTFSREQEIRFQELQSTTNNIQEQNIKLRESVDMMSSKYDEFLLRISSLETERREDKKTIREMEEKLEALERKARVSGIEIRNVPKIKGETKENLSDTVLNLAKAIDMDIDPLSIRDVYRLSSKDASNPIIVDFSTVLIKDKFTRGVKNFNKTRTKTEKLNTTHLNPQHIVKPIYVSETLTHRTHRLYYLARMFKKSHGYTFCWTSNGIVYLKKSLESSQIRITSESDIEKLGTSE